MKFLLSLFSFLFCLQTLVAQVSMDEHKLLRRLESKPFRSDSCHEVFIARPTKEIRRRSNENDTLPLRVEPLLAGINRWHQYSAPYWNLTPTIDGKHCPAGCVALAQAQVMHYWQHPQRGKGEHTYNDSTGCGQVLSARFHEHTYDWGKMLYEYEDDNYTEEEVYPMALLLSDCGISVDMRYTSGSSGAQPVMHSVSLTNYFGYDKGIQLHFRDFYSKQETITMLKRELAAGRPVLVSAYNYRIGHAFVIDGYNEDDWFHIMVGNPKGKGDGWTSLECMNGGYEEHDNTLSPESGMNLMQVFTTGIQPDTISRPISHEFAMEGINLVSAEGRDATVCVAQLSNVGYNLHEDSVCIMLTQGDNIVRSLYAYDRNFLLEEIDDTTYTDTISLTLPPDIGKGSYHISPMFKDNGAWKPVRTSMGTPNYLLCDIGDDGLSISSDTAHTAFLTLEDLDIPELIISGSAPDVSIKLKNYHVESSGRLYFFMEPTIEGVEPFYLYKQGFFLDADETRTYRFCTQNIYPPKTGTYRLRVLYDNNLFSQSLTELTDEATPIYVSVLHANIFQIAEK